MKSILGIAAIGLVSMAFVMKKAPVKPQDGTGIKFEHITLEEAKKLATENEQLIFIDCYTSWCGPCKKMAATSFMNEQVGEIFNESFVNIKVDIEKDVDGPELARLYKIKAYPTLLIIDTKGKLLKQVVGFQTEDKLISLANSVN